MSGRSRIVAAAADDDVAGTAAAPPVAVIVVARSVHLASAIWRLSSIRMRIMPAPGASALPRLRPGTASCGPCRVSLLSVQPISRRKRQLPIGRHFAVRQRQQGQQQHG